MDVLTLEECFFPVSFARLKQATACRGTNPLLSDLKAGQWDKVDRCDVTPQSGLFVPV